MIESERLSLRELKKEDIDSVMDFWGDSEVMQYCGSAGTRDRESRALEYYIRMQAEKGFSPFLVSLKDSGNIIGVCGFNPPDPGYDAEMMYHFSKKHWGMGYATEAVKTYLEYAKKRLDIKRIGAAIDFRNLASKNVLDKNGFVYVGVKYCDDTGQDELYYELIL